MPFDWLITELGDVLKDLPDPDDKDSQNEGLALVPISDPIIHAFENIPILQQVLHILSFEKPKDQVRTTNVAVVFCNIIFVRCNYIIIKRKKYKRGLIYEKMHEYMLLWEVIRDDWMPQWVITFDHVLRIRGRLLRTKTYKITKIQRQLDWTYCPLWTNKIQQKR